VGVSSRPGKQPQYLSAGRKRLDASFGVKSQDPTFFAHSGTIMTLHGEEREQAVVALQPSPSLGQRAWRDPVGDASPLATVILSHSQSAGNVSPFSQTRSNSATVTRTNSAGSYPETHLIEAELRRKVSELEAERVQLTVDRDRFDLASRAAADSIAAASSASAAAQAQVAQLEAQRDWLIDEREQLSGAASALDMVEATASAAAAQARCDGESARARYEAQSANAARAEAIEWLEVAREAEAELVVERQGTAHLEAECRSELGRAEGRNERLTAELVQASRDLAVFRTSAASREAQLLLLSAVPVYASPVPALGAPVYAPPVPAIWSQTSSMREHRIESRLVESIITADLGECSDQCDMEYRLERGSAFAQRREMAKMAEMRERMGWMAWWSLVGVSGFKWFELPCSSRTDER